MLKTVSLETSKLLKEAGYPQQSYFHWRKAGNLGWQVEMHLGTMMPGQFAAPTAEEILERLPTEINIPFKNGKKRNDNHILTMRKVNYPNLNGYRVRYWYPNSREEINFYDKSLAEAVGKLYLYLAKEGLLKTE